MKKQRGIFGGHVIHSKAEERNGQPVGVVEGYLATWDVDRGKDQFLPGAFLDAIDDLRKRNRQLRFKDQHWKTMGGFMPETLKEDQRGLFGIGEINLNTQVGNEAFSLVQQRVITDFSVGWSWNPESMLVENGIRKISKSGLWEASLVDEPMNIEAMVTTFKGAVDIKALPSSVAENDEKWDEVGAAGRWRTQTGSEDSPSDDYQKGFLWFDDIDPDEFDSYKLQVVDLVSGEEKIIPRAVFAARAILEGAKGGIDLEDEDREKVEGTVNALYERMGLDAPFDGSKASISIIECKGLVDGLLHDMIKAGRLSGTSVDYFLSLRQSGPDAGSGTKEDAELMEALRGLSNTFKE